MSGNDWFWLATIDDMPCESFKTRQDAVRWLKAILKQELEDYDTQDVSTEYDYPIEICKIEIKRIERRKSDLGA